MTVSGPPVVIPADDLPDPLRLTADWIYTGQGEAQPGGTLVIEQGLISDLSTHTDPRAIPVASLSRTERAAGDLTSHASNRPYQTVLLPGLINCHTHLEFSDLAQPLEPSLPFTSWLRHLIQDRRSRGVDSRTAVHSGWREARATGTRLLAEISTSDEVGPWGETALRSPHDPVVLSFREILGLRREARGPQLDVARRHLLQCQLKGVRGAISPHAPYSVQFDLFTDLVQLAVQEQVPVAMHLAETLAERELLHAGTGEFVTFLTEMGVWQPDLIPRGLRPFDYFQHLAEARRALLVHANYLDHDEFAFLRDRPQMSVVYCPRTHAFFQHPPHPWQRLIAQGTRVVLGTDGRGSNPDLSLWAELQFLHRMFPDIAPQQLLALATTEAAEALGLANEYGRLQPGHCAAWTAIRIPPAKPSRFWSCLLDPAAQPLDL